MPAASAEQRKKDTRKKLETPIKPASQESDWRSAAAMVALRALAPSDFANASGLWTGSLMQVGLIFQEQAVSGGEFEGSNQRYYLSLGFHSYAALFWQIDEVQSGVFKLADTGASNNLRPSERVRFVCCTELHESGDGEPFQGVPVEPCC